MALHPVCEQRLVVLCDLAKVMIKSALRSIERTAQPFDRQRVATAAP
jgi:hypothetical protein